MTSPGWGAPSGAGAAGPGRRFGPRLLHPDRAALPPGRLLALATATAVSVGLAALIAASRGAFNPLVGAGSGVMVALLAVLALPSVSVRLAARVAVLVGGSLLVRFGALAGGTTGPGSERILAWTVATVAVLVLADRVTTDVRRPLGGAAPLPGAWSTLRTTALIGGLVLLFAVSLVPTVQRNFAGAASTGAAPTLGSDGSGGSLRASTTLDAATRPRLSEAVVMTVEANRPSFWRGETYDVWDGQTWHQRLTNRYPLAPGGAVVHDPNDLGATGSDILRQRVRIEAPYADVLFAAPSAVQVEAADVVAQRPDATLTTGDRPMGRGATYTVISRRIAVDPARLRAVDSQPIPAAVEADARTPVASARVKAAARQVLRGVPTAYDKVKAIEQWMGARTTYSIDAPLAPDGSDVVDHFLFVSRQGWCEQIASSLVVMLRLGGVPARLVTGYVPGERDPVTGSWVVRELHAHAWAEVWFPSVGWVSFDPTASVPFAGTESAPRTVGGWLGRHAWQLVVGLLVLAVASGPGLALARRLARRRPRRHPVAGGWAARAAARLDRIGRRAGRPRAPAESSSAYGGALARALDDERLVHVGRALDDALFAPEGPDARERDAVDAVLADLRSARGRPPTLEHSGAGTGHRHERDAHP